MNSPVASSASPADTAWYLLQCKPQQGFRAELHLQNQGFHCFHPVVTVERLRRQQRVQLVEPLFPGYLFIQLGGADSWAPVRSTRGVSRMVAFNGNPLPVPDGVIGQIRRRTMANQPVLPVLQPGDAVQISDGAFAGVDAIFQCFDGAQRAVILLQLLQRQQTMSVPVSVLRKA